MSNASSANVAGNIATTQGSATSGASLAVPQRGNRIRVTLINHSTTDIFFGDATVSAGTGAKLTGVAGASVTLAFYGDLWVITSAGSAGYSVVEEF